MAKNFSFHLKRQTFFTKCGYPYLYLIRLRHSRIIRCGREVEAVIWGAASKGVSARVYIQSTVCRRKLAPVAHCVPSIVWCFFTSCFTIISLIALARVALTEPSNLTIIYDMPEPLKYSTWKNFRQSLKLGRTNLYPLSLNCRTVSRYRWCWIPLVVLLSANSSRRPAVRLDHFLRELSTLQITTIDCPNKQHKITVLFEKLD